MSDRVLNGGRGGGINPEGFDYPLTDPSDDVAGLLADFYLGFRSPAAARWPLKIRWLYGMTEPPGQASSAGARSASSSSAGQPNPAHAADVWVVDDEGETVFYSPDATRYQSRDWGERFRSHEWVSDDAVCRIVQHTGQHFADQEQDYPVELFPERAVLDARTWVQWPAALTGVVVDGTLITGAIEIENGYNVEFRPVALPEKSGHVRKTKLYTSAEPGGGDGRFPACDEVVPLVRKINQVGPDAFGRFRLTTDACYRVGRPGPVSLGTMTPLPTGGLQIAADCVPCFTCDDVVAAHDSVATLDKNYRVMGTRLSDVRDTYARSRSRWLDQKACREAHPIRIVLLSYRARGASWVNVGISFCNATASCRGELKMTMTWEASPGIVTGYIDPESVWQFHTYGHKPLPYDLGGTWPTYTAYWSTLDPQKSAKLRFQAYLGFVATGAWAKLTVAAEVQGETQTGWTASDTVALRRPH